MALDFQEARGLCESSGAGGFGYQRGMAKPGTRGRGYERESSARRRGGRHSSSALNVIIINADAWEGVENTSGDKGDVLAGGIAKSLGGARMHGMRQRAAHWGTLGQRAAQGWAQQGRQATAGLHGSAPGYRSASPDRGVSTDRGSFLSRWQRSRRPQAHWAGAAAGELDCSSACCGGGRFRLASAASCSAARAAASASAGGAGVGRGRKWQAR